MAAGELAVKREWAVKVGLDEAISPTRGNSDAGGYDGDSGVNPEGATF